MLTQEQAVEIKVLARRGMAIREIARQVGCSRNTVKRYLHDANAGRYRARRPRMTKLDPFKAIIDQRLSDYPELSAVRLHAECKAAGYAGSASRGMSRSRRPLLSFGDSSGGSGQSMARSPSDQSSECSEA